MSENKNKKVDSTSIIEDGFSWLGETIGQTLSLGADVVVGTVKGVTYDMPMAVVDGFQAGFNFSNDDKVEPTVEDAEIIEKVEPKETITLSKEEYKNKLLDELARVDDAIAADTKAQEQN